MSKPRGLISVVECSLSDVSVTVTYQDKRNTQPLCKKNKTGRGQLRSIETGVISIITTKNIPCRLASVIYGWHQCMRLNRALQEQCRRWQPRKRSRCKCWRKGPAPHSRSTLVLQYVTLRCLSSFSSKFKQSLRLCWEFTCGVGRQQQTTNILLCV